MAYPKRFFEQHKPSSKIRSLCLMKCSSERLQRKPMYKFFFFSFRTFTFLPCQPGHSSGKDAKVSEMKNKQNYMGLLIQKIFSKFYSLLLKHFVEHKPLISKECKFKNYLPARPLFS